MTDPTKCPRCGRDLFVPGYGVPRGADECAPGDLLCPVVAVAYLRGLRAGVVYVTCFPPGACVDWSDVDAELARMEGER